MGEIRMSRLGPFEENTIIVGDCLDIMAQMPDNCIDLVITSPPYKEQDGYTEDLIRRLSQGLIRVLKQNGLFFLNFGHLVNDKFRPFRVCQLCLEAGFNLNDTITWEKIQFSPIRGLKRVNNLTEFVFLLYSEEMPNLDRLSIGVPYQDKSNIGRYSDIDLRCRGNIWKIGYKTIRSRAEKFHENRFPEGLVHYAILLSGKRGMVFDPFMGSGTTAVVAKELDRNFFGCDINPDYVEIALKRLDGN